MLQLYDYGYDRVTTHAAAAVAVAVAVAAVAGAVTVAVPLTVAVAVVRQRGYEDLRDCFLQVMSAGMPCPGGTLTETTAICLVCPGDLAADSFREDALTRKQRARSANCGLGCVRSCKLHLKAMIYIYIYIIIYIYIHTI